MSTHRSTEAHDQVPTAPGLHWHDQIAFALIFMGVMTLLSTLGRAYLLRQPPAQFSPALTHIELPAGQCFAPQPGDVLHITVTTLDLTRQDIRVTCLNAGPRPTWSGL